MNVGSFIFESYAYAPEKGVLTLAYTYENGLSFEEKIAFPLPVFPPDEQTSAALDTCFRLLFLLAGVSYYKAYAPERLICRAFPLDPVTASFVEKVYRNGLGEFAYRNNLDLSDRLKFSVNNIAPPVARPVKLSPRPLVPVGGGKDSIVTIEALKKQGMQPILFALGPKAPLPAPIAGTIGVSGLPFLKVERTLSPTILEANKSGALNGHVPITAILSVIAIATALLHGMDSVVLSNEHSASAPNLVKDGQEINHQYSKSFAFEKDLAAYVRGHITPDLHYFSLLRPLTEAAIAQRFAQDDAYDTVFRSCNTAFRQDAATRGAHWCGACPKCRFIFLALANFMDKERLLRIFGANLLDDAAQTDAFAALCGIDAHKPFECVGTTQESTLLMEHLTHLDAWKNDAVVRELSSRFVATPEDFSAAYQALFTLQDEHSIPPTYLEALL
ncbi:MAG TPA: hypothetical protein DCY07_04910 [Rhodospirillaceae bacterium]|nr:hypothetical protein [Rhodospirillaceae bacterium]